MKFCLIASDAALSMKIYMNSDSIYIRKAKVYSLHEKDTFFLFPIIYNVMIRINGNRIKKRKALTLSKSFGIKKTDVEIIQVMNKASAKKRPL